MHLSDVRGLLRYSACVSRVNSLANFSSATASAPRALVSYTALAAMAPTQQEGSQVTPKQYFYVMKAMWSIVDKYFDAKKVLTEKGHALVQTYAIKAAHPEMPYALHFLSMMCALCNGAKASLFSSVDSPLFHFFLNVI